MTSLRKWPFRTNPLIPSGLVRFPQTQPPIPLTVMPFIVHETGMGVPDC